MAKVLQKFKPSDLANSRNASANDIAEFLENFIQMASGQDAPTKLISLRVPENILSAFKFRARAGGTKYQTKIVQLMREWIKSADTTQPPDRVVARARRK